MKEDLFLFLSAAQQILITVLLHCLRSHLNYAPEDNAVIIKAYGVHRNDVDWAEREVHPR